MKTVFKKYRLIINEQEQDISVKIFPHEQSLRRHLEGHILSEMEPWDRVFSRQQLTDARKNLLDNNVISRETYGDIVEVVDDAIQYALKEPLYVWAEQIVEEEGKVRKSLYCISKDGFILVLDETCLRTMYFCTTLGRNPSKYILFKTAWKDIMLKLSRPKYVDDKMNRTIVNRGREWISQANWTTCPNPHPRPINKESVGMPKWRVTNKTKYCGAKVISDE